MAGPFDALLCDDTDLCLRAAGDWAALLPESQAVAAAKDGALAGWTLSSAAAPPGAQGVAPGMVVTLGPAGAPGSSSGSVPQRAHFRVASADPDTGAVTLARLGLADGLGQPPAPVYGASGVEFKCWTALPQVREASRWAISRFQLIDANDVWRLGDFKAAAAIVALILLYRGQWHGAKDRDTFEAKAEALAKDLEAEVATLDLTYGPTDEGRRASVAQADPQALGYRVPDGYGGVYRPEAGFLLPGGLVPDAKSAAAWRWPWYGTG